MSYARLASDGFIGGGDGTQISFRYILILLCDVIPLADDVAFRRWAKKQLHAAWR